MAEFMIEHPNLAKNILPNCGQGKAVSMRLWDQLTIQLNKFGPPVKDEKCGERYNYFEVYSDQKHNVKKSCHSIRHPKREEQILQAADIRVSGDGLSSNKSFGSSKTTKQICADDIEKAFNDMLDEEDDENINEPEAVEKEPIIKAKKVTEREFKLDLPRCHIEKYEDYQRSIKCKLDRLLNIKERSLKLKEEEHVANISIKNIDYEIKSVELEMLEENSYLSK